MRAAFEQIQPAFARHFGDVVAADQGAAFKRTEQRRFEQRGIVVNQIDDAKRALGVTRRIKKDDIELVRFHFRERGHAFTAHHLRLTLPGKLAQGGEDVALDETQADRQIVKTRILFADSDA